MYIRLHGERWVTVSHRHFRVGGRIGPDHVVRTVSLVDHSRGIDGRTEGDELESARVIDE
ncbi:hypothetical protein AArc1_2909 [Natrarchaeobaculum sulfurireducens]|uniref:Uncharacterized protein n=1 Tax=Natrarchaeobaculum sulfurireducens TaxID=2044521 RepID=A0A346PI73_9EURY|nr:hypothetical protein AArc1_2909 [Natrarchaeobaculum sulfurireducens]